MVSSPSEDIINQDVDVEELQKLKTVYSPRYFQFVIGNNLDEILLDYYICENGKFLDASGQYINYRRNMNIDPGMYLRTFIYPVIASVKMKY